MDIGRELAALKKRLETVERSARLSSASLDNTALQVKDGAGSLRGILGQQGDGTTAVNIVNGAAPPAPATPTAAPALGGVSVGWAGAFANGAIIPMDWARVEVHASPAAGFSPTADTLKATIETAQGGIVYIPSTTPLYVALLARNTSGAASPATTTVGPYTPKPVAGEIGIGEITGTLIADNAITTPKVFANAVTTAKLAAGSVDAVALKADAITGKTITGGVINGAEFHSDNGTGGLVDIANGAVIATGASGWKAVIETHQYTPAFGFVDSAGATAGVVYGSGNDALPNLQIASGLFSDAGITDWRWLTTMGTTSGGNRTWTRRVRYSNPSIFRGGEVMADDDAARISYIDSEDAASNTFLTVLLGHAQLANGRLSVSPPASSNSGIYVSAATGHTGNLIRAQLNAVDRFSVSAGGNVTAAGTVSADQLSVANTTFTSYTPVVTNGGSATYSTRIGHYYKIGKLVYVHIYVACSAAGSGNTGITVTLPSTPYRGAGDIRQYLPLYAGGILAGGNSATGGTGIANINPTGSGTEIDQLRSASDIQYRGTNLSNTSTFTIQGWYREA
ncbi:hypothetical protein ACFVS9_28160 [Streptomyces sp. NPDC058008]|uniref:hypothetical protein n=1 Tax=Streptomyces sp. NPDC058008 TaxID=3346303 RepID=UPI0036DFFA62